MHVFTVQIFRNVPEFFGCLLYTDIRLETQTYDKMAHISEYKSTRSLLYNVVLLSRCLIRRFAFAQRGILLASIAALGAPNADYIVVLAPHHLFHLPLT